MIYVSNLKRNLTKEKEVRDTTLRELFKDYRKSAKKKNLDFFLSLNMFLTFVNSRCFYCDSDFSNSKGYRQDLTIRVWYNGIDRIDNSKGYIEGNIVTCCWKCNQWKKADSIDDFLSHVRKLSLNLEGLDNWMTEQKLNA
jgi:hypothetical protein